MWKSIAAWLEKWRIVSIWLPLLLVVVILNLLWLLTWSVNQDYGLVATNIRLAGQINALEATLRSATNRDAIDAEHRATEAKGQALQLQRACGQQAETAFRRLGYSRFANPPSPMTGSYQSHYDQGLNACFIAIEVSGLSPTDGRETSDRYLYDADQLRKYAEYVVADDKSDASGGGALLSCKLFGSITDVKSCESKSEYDAFVKSYME